MESELRDLGFPQMWAKAALCKDIVSHRQTFLQTKCREAKKKCKRLIAAQRTRYKTTNYAGFPPCITLQTQCCSYPSKRCQQHCSQKATRAWNLSTPINKAEIFSLFIAGLALPASPPPEVPSDRPAPPQTESVLGGRPTPVRPAPWQPQHSHPDVAPSVSHSVRPSVRPSIPLGRSACPSVHSIGLSALPFERSIRELWSVWMSSLCRPGSSTCTNASMPACLPSRRSICLSVCLSVCLCACLPAFPDAPLQSPTPVQPVSTWRKHNGCTAMLM
jgi:hypothetical protein